MKVYFWQTMISPHMMGLASALVDLGIDVCYVAREEISKVRYQQGWVVPDAKGVEVVISANYCVWESIIMASDSNDIHISQGIRGSDYSRLIQSILIKHDRKFVVVLEKIQDKGLKGWLKRYIYRKIISRTTPHFRSVLAIGSQTKKWLIDRGLPEEIIYPFAYFLEAPRLESVIVANHRQEFRFLFVGRLDSNKNLSLLLDSLALIDQHYDFSLTVIGSGPLECELRNRASLIRGLQIEWLGTLPMNDVKRVMRESDCLVLPSLYDGWGAVTSEALLVGTPVICSDACGSSDVVESAPYSQTFESGHINKLRMALSRSLERGKPSLRQRNELSTWASCIDSSAGARYLLDIIRVKNNGKQKRPEAPWKKVG